MSVNVGFEFSALDRVRRASRFLKVLTSLGIVVLLGTTLAIAVIPAWLDPVIQEAYPEIGMEAGVELWAQAGIAPLKRAGMIVLMAVPLAAVLFGLWHVRLLFGSYERGEIFTGAAARHIRLVGLAMAANAVTSVIVHPLGSVLLTYDNPPGNRQVSISLDGDIYMLLLTGGLLIVIGWIMGEAARLADENRQIV